MKVLFFGCMILLLSLACRKTNSNNRNASDIFPDKIGDQWVYLVNDTTVENGLVTSIEDYNMNVSVTGSIILPGGINANIWVYSRPGHSDTCYVVQSSDTVQFYDIHELGTHLYSRRYIIPMALNNSWQYSPSYYNVTVDSLADILVGQNVFKRSYRIYGISGMPDGMFTVSEWFQNNIGTVKRYFNPFGQLILTKHFISWSLLSYDLE